MKAFHHILKIHPKPFQDQQQGLKNWELRKDDRCPGFQPQQVVTLLEWDPATRAYTGGLAGPRVIVRVLRHEDMPEGLAPGWCIFTHRPLVEPPAATPEAPRGLQDAWATVLKFTVAIPGLGQKQADELMAALEQVKSGLQGIGESV